MWYRDMGTSIGQLVMVVLLQSASPPVFVMGRLGEWSDTERRPPWFDVWVPLFRHPGSLSKGGDYLCKHLAALHGMWCRCASSDTQTRPIVGCFDRK
ncbi:hypothetical protein LZ31DRAFT_226135 [Colletotrichum somersetense]|nr:hypothetical protein LZ31DRAFT_226135 [Colletotrichum somersetense]